MTEPDYLKTGTGRTLAYRRQGGQGPGVVFLGGFMSDMEGTKAAHLAAWAQARGRAFVRFDYSGHGASSGAFTEGCIGDWAEDALAAIGALSTGPQVLVGSSMGGWIALKIARDRPELVAGLVGIAAAPDFTEDSMWAGFDSGQRAALLRDGQVALPSAYAESPYVITRRLVEDGRDNLVLRAPLPLAMPVRLLQGTADADVPQEVALRLLSHAEGPDIRLTLAKGADHRFSAPANLALLSATLDELLAGLGEGQTV